MANTWLRLSFSVAIALAMAIRGVRHKSLSNSGAIGALIVGFVCMSASIRFGMALLAFFVSSSILTKRGAKRKKQLEHGYKEGGQRTIVQVAANALTGVICSIVAINIAGLDDMPIDYGKRPLLSAMYIAYLGHFATCNGDTWASELGILSTSPPRLITTGRVVPPGTNGGVTGAGLAASGLGGLLIGITFWLFGCLVATETTTPVPPQWPLIFVGAASGLVGSIIDSLMGATIQYSGWNEKLKMVVNEPMADATLITGRNIVDNHQVNFLSSLVTAIIAAVVTPLIMA